MVQTSALIATEQQFNEQAESKNEISVSRFAGLQNSVSPNLSPVDMASLAAAMRMGNNGDMSGGAQGSTGPQQQGVQATGPEQTLRMHQAEALLRSQAEAALRLAVSGISTNEGILLFRNNLPFAMHLSAGIAGSSGGGQFRGWRRRETSPGPAQRWQHLWHAWTSHEPTDVSARHLTARPW